MSFLTKAAAAQSRNNYFEAYMRQNTENRLRKEIAQEAAKLVAVDGLEDYLQAKKKAADQLGIYDKRVYPSNSEIYEIEP